METGLKGVNRDSFDSRDLIYRPSLLDLKHELIPDWEGIRIGNQLQEGACTGFGLAATINYLLFQRGDRMTTVSPRMLFEVAKRYDQWPGNRYDWSSARGAMKGWYMHGACSEKVWSHPDPDDLAISDVRQQDALLRPLGAYYRVLPRRSDVHAALNEVGAIFAAAATHEGWNRPRDGVIELTDKGEKTGHAFAIVGYTREGFIVQNSWGKDWGGVMLKGTRREGLAIWTYRDFDQNVWDLWVARMALPVESLESLRSDYTIGNEGSRKTQGGPPPAEVQRHLVHIDDGQFDTESEYPTRAHWAAQVIADKVRAGAERGELKLLLHAHGGVNTNDAVAKRVRAWRDIVDENGVEHLHFMWETGFGAELKDILFGKDKFADQRAGGFGDWKDKILEKLTRPIGKALWNEMKSGASLAFRRGAAGTEVLRMVAEAIAACPGLKTHITLSAHSAGAIWMGEALVALQQLQPSFHVDHLVLLAPACRVDFFERKIAPHVVAGRVGKLSIFQLTAELELSDDVGKIYGKSLLYYVSNACEEKRGESPLLGMKVFNGRWRNLRNELQQLDRLAVYTSTLDQNVTRSQTHSDFDNDAYTMNTLLELACAGKPRRKFTERELEDA